MGQVLAGHAASAIMRRVNPVRDPPCSKSSNPIRVEQECTARAGLRQRLSEELSAGLSPEDPELYQGGVAPGGVAPFPWLVDSLAFKQLVGCSSRSLAVTGSQGQSDDGVGCTSLLR